MSDPRVMGVTGVVYALNRADNIITRITDLHYVHSCLVIRQGLSATGDIFTASGALAVWRSEVVMDNLTEYLDRGVGDDRHLTHFAQRRGRTTAVPDAYVRTNVPNTMPDLFRQRIRWARDYYLCTALDVRYLSGWSLLLRSTDFALMCFVPVFTLTAFMIFPFAQWQVPWAGVALWVLFLYAQTSCYLNRTGVGRLERLTVWLLLTPVLYLFQLLVVGPATLVALLHLRHRCWQTRNGQRPAVVRAGRSTYLDTLRGVAIVGVVVSDATGAVWPEWVFPSVGVTFALTGSLMARSLANAGDRPELVIWSRFRRVVPALWALGIVLVPVMLLTGWGPDDAHPPDIPAILAWIFPLADPPGADWAAPVTGVLWYMRTYLWLVILSPAMWAGFRRWPLPTTVAPVALVVAAPHLTYSPWLSDVVLQLGTYAPCWILGFWHATGGLRRATGWVTVPVAGAALASAMFWVYLFPAPDWSLRSRPVAETLWSAAFVLALFTVEPAMRGLRRTRPLLRLLRALNARAVTIYLWHPVAIVAAFAVVNGVPDASLGAVARSALAAPLACVLLVAACRLLGWVEDLTGPRPARARAPSSGRHHTEIMFALHPQPDLDQTVVLSANAVALLRNLQPPAPRAVGRAAVAYPYQPPRPRVRLQRRTPEMPARARFSRRDSRATP